jgi:hypothetical protein
VAVCRMQVVWHKREYAVGREPSAGSSWYKAVGGAQSAIGRWWRAGCM